MYESWNGQHVFILSNKAVDRSDIAVAKAARQYNAAKERRMVHIWASFAIVSFVLGLAMMYLSLWKERPSSDTISADMALLLLLSILPILNGTLALTMRGRVKRHMRDIEAYLASTIEQRSFDVVDDSRPFWHGIVRHTPEWEAIAEEMHLRTALGSELTGMVCREWLRCPQTFEAAPVDSPRHAELLEQGRHFGLRMHAKHILHHKLLAQASA